MNKKIFHKNLYKDQLKQLRLIGFIGLGLLSLIAILMPVGKAITASRYQDFEMGNKVVRESISIMGSHFYLFFTFTLLVPLLALSCFHYLTQRNSSDFYHSLPHTRTCVFTCNLAAIFTWTTLLVWVPTVISIIMYTIFSKYFILEIPLLLQFAFNVYLASLLVTSSISIACSITGTIFTNVVVSGMIIFLPRIFIIVITNMIAGSSHVLVSSHLFPLLDYEYNIIFGILGSIPIISPVSTSIGWGTILYSIILTLIYLALGLLVYKRRKSETSNHAAVSKKVQTIIRLLLGTTVSLAPMALIFTIITGSANLSDNRGAIMIYGICILYLVACFVMLLYELLTSKKLKNVIKALPSIGILAIINIIILLGAFGIYKSFLSYRPDPEDIDYFVTERSINGSDTAYYDTLANSVHIEDDKAIKMISDALKTNLENGDDQSSLESMAITVGIHSGLTTHYRRLWMSVADYNELMKSYGNSQEYKDAYKVLPSLAGNKLTLNNLRMSDEEYLELYNTAKEEIKTLSFEDWDTALSSGGYGALDTITFYATVGSQSLKGIIPITGTLPKTYSKYFELANKYQNKNQEKILTILKDALSSAEQNTSDNNEYYININLIDMENNLSGDFGLDSTSFSKEFWDEEQISMNKSLVENIISSAKDYSTFNPKTDYVLKLDFTSYSEKEQLYDCTGVYLFIIEKTKLQQFADYFGFNSEEESIE